MKALLLRVGIDKTYGALSPVWGDMGYEYIPIYLKDIKEKEKNEKRTYKDLYGSIHKFAEDAMSFKKYSANIIQYLPKKLHDKKIHLDPEFGTFTYGDPSILKRKSLLELDKGDMLVFYMGGKFQKDNGKGEEGCFIFGFFDVKKVYDFNNMSKEERKKAEKVCANNAHVISSKSKNNLVIVKGSTKSKKLKRCIQITCKNKKSNNPPYHSDPEIMKYLGIRESVVRAVPLWIKDEIYILNLKEMLGISAPMNFEEVERMSLNEFFRLVSRDKKLVEREKDYLCNVFMSKSGSISSDTDGMWELDFKNFERMNEYFELYHKVYNDL